MSDTKILQSILDGQTQIRQDIKSVENKLSNLINETRLSLTKRIDKLGKQLVYLEDDT